MMTKIRKLFVSVLVFIGLFGNTGLLNVNAAAAPSSVTTKAKSSLYYYTEKNGTDYISGYNFYRKELTDGTLAYCVSNIDTTVPAGTTLTSRGPILDKGLDYIIKNGYPYKTFTGDAKKDYYITQSAIWEYFDETRGSDNWKNTSFTSSSSGMKKYVYDLVVAAKNASKAADPTYSITASVSSATMSKSGNYFVSKEISVELNNTKDTYTVALVDAPAGTIIKSTSGEEKTTFAKGETFKVYVPTSSVPVGEGSVKLTVSSENVKKNTYYYSTGKSGYQNISPVTLYEIITKVTSSELVLNYKKQITKLSVSKQDITSQTELPGATLTIKDKDGKVVEEWVSGDKPHYVEGLKAGTYTLTEKSAPKGYVLSEETIEFTLKEDGKVTSVVMYNTKEKEPTKYKISKQDITSKEELPGATLVIKDKNGKVVEEWVSGNEPHYVKNLAVGTYTLTETIAPDGYVLSSETINFTVEKDGKVKTVVMYNELTKTKISKQDITTKEELPGATLVIKDKDGKVVAEWVSTNEPHYIEGLEAGVYTLTETIAPEGYQLSSETIKFTIEEDGTLTTVVMYNTRYTEVPITDLNVNMITIIGASILMLLGTGLVLYAKHSK